ncbi:Uncharacterised protein [Mycobacteroides abscessus subsp. abscessus]|nr:Uncharacterised protein [Mycobacteroides abscessus subsp. abscessus]
MRSALPGYVRREQQSVRSWRDSSCFSQQFLKALFRCEYIPEPAQAVACCKGDSHRVKNVLGPMIEIMDFSTEIFIAAAFIRKDHTRGTDAAKGFPLLKDTGADRSAGIVGTAGKYLDRSRKAGRC